MLDALDLNLVRHGLARQPLIAEIVGILHVEGTRLARLGSSKVLREFGNGVASADLHHHLFHFHRLGIGIGVAFLRRAFEADYTVVSVGQSTIFFHRRVSRMLLAQIAQRGLDFFITHVRVDGLNLDVVVGSERELGEDLKTRRKLSGSPS